MLEISQAIKCPSIDVHLTTFKKFQQSFCKQATLEKVLGDRYKAHLDTLKQIFKGMWSLEDYETDQEV
jgi:hypothetical protein